jgi:hypothetical protein
MGGWDREHSWAAVGPLRDLAQWITRKTIDRPRAGLEQGGTDWNAGDGAYNATPLLTNRARRGLFSAQVNRAQLISDDDQELAGAPSSVPWSLPWAMLDTPKDCQGYVEDELDARCGDGVDAVKITIVFDADGENYAQSNLHGGLLADVDRRCGAADQLDGLASTSQIGSSNSMRPLTA